MKIIFESGEERNRVIRKLAQSEICPCYFGLKDTHLPLLDEEVRNECWGKALEEIEIKK